MLRKRMALDGGNPRFEAIHLLTILATLKELSTLLTAYS